MTALDITFLAILGIATIQLVAKLMLHFMGWT